MEYPATLTSGNDEALRCSVFEKEFGTNVLANISAWWLFDSYSKCPERDVSLIRVILFINRALYLLSKDTENANIFLNSVFGPGIWLVTLCGVLDSQYTGNHRPPKVP